MYYLFLLMLPLVAQNGEQQDPVVAPQAEGVEITPAAEAENQGPDGAGQDKPAEGAPANQAQDEERQPPGFSLYSLVPFLIIGLLFYYLILRPQRQEQSKRQEMLKAVKKNDRVVTAGGIYGVVTNIHQEADEITIKVDEATNTKLRMTLGSISRVVGDEPSKDTTSK